MYLNIYIYNFWNQLVLPLGLHKKKLLIIHHPHPVQLFQPKSVQKPSPNVTINGWFSIALLSLSQKDWRWFPITFLIISNSCFSLPLQKSRGAEIICVKNSGRT